MEQLLDKINDIINQINDGMLEILIAKEELERLEKDTRINTRDIKDVENLKKRLKLNGLYSNELEEFLDDYMKFHNE